MHRPVFYRDPALMTAFRDRKDIADHRDPADSTEQNE
jgi:hypothetical protein